MMILVILVYRDVKLGKGETTSHECFNLDSWVLIELRMCSSQD